MNVAIGERVLPVSCWVGFVQWLLTCATFSLGLALWFVDWVGVFFPLLAKLEQVKCSGLTVPQGSGTAWKGVMKFISL